MVKKLDLMEVNAKTESDWIAFKTDEEWDNWMVEHEIPEGTRVKKLASIIG
jgi:hypothetical protein